LNFLNIEEQSRRRKSPLEISGGGQRHEIIHPSVE
jgi:hypothetical protein